MSVGVGLRGSIGSAVESSPAVEVQKYAPKRPRGKPLCTVSTATSPSESGTASTSTQMHCLGKPQRCNGVNAPLQTTSQRPKMPSSVCVGGTPGLRSPARKAASTTTGNGCAPASPAIAARRAPTRPAPLVLPAEAATSRSGGNAPASSRIPARLAVCVSKAVAAKSNHGRTRVKPSNLSSIVGSFSCSSSFCNREARLEQTLSLRIAIGLRSALQCTPPHFPKRCRVPRAAIRAPTAAFPTARSANEATPQGTLSNEGPCVALAQSLSGCLGSTTAAPPGSCKAEATARRGGNGDAAATARRCMRNQRPADLTRNPAHWNRRA
mmetsp:Transcript_102632/g.290051  ORF Transcript_102632/g.290051 Transcript_102632/m.290051 type:complete len:324 (+) Transcript_102632:603-1574(+)